MRVAQLRVALRRVGVERRLSSWRTGLLILGGLAAGVSCGGIDDVQLFSDDGTVPPASGGMGGMGGTTSMGGDGPASSPPGLGTAGSMPSDPPDSIPAGGSGGASSALGGSSGAAAQGGAAGPSGAGEEADAGVSGGDSPQPPLEDPACMGLALRLDGATFASIPRPVQDDFTLEAWVETRESLLGPSAFNGRAIFDSDVIGMGSPDDFAVTVLNDRIAFGVGGPDTTLQGITVVTSDRWVHVAVTRRAATGELRIFLNGALEAVATAANRRPLTGRPDLALGGFSSTRKFIGSIDEVRVWNVSRSATQIAGAMRERLSGSEQGLVGYYTFEDGGTAETADASSLGSAATLTGSPEYVPSTALCSPD